MEGIVFIEWLPITLIFMHLFHCLHGALEERHINTIHVFTSQKMG